MNRKLLTALAVVLLIVGLTMLIAPRISNRVGEQIAHTTIEDFKALKSKATSDEPTEKDELSEDSSANTKPKKNNAQNEYASIVQNNDGTIFEEELSMSENTTVDFDRLYSDSIAYNDNLKKHQGFVVIQAEITAHGRCHRRTDRASKIASANGAFSVRKISPRYPTGEKRFMKRILLCLTKARMKIFRTIWKTMRTKVSQ